MVFPMSRFTWLIMVDYSFILALFLPSMPSLAVGMQQIIEDLTNKHEYPQIFASVIIALIPVLAIYIGFSKTIMVNTTVGGLKG